MRHALGQWGVAQRLLRRQDRGEQNHPEEPHQVRQAVRIDRGHRGKVAPGRDGGQYLRLAADPPLDMASLPAGDHPVLRESRIRHKA